MNILSVFECIGSLDDVEVISEPAGPAVRSIAALSSPVSRTAPGNRLFNEIPARNNAHNFLHADLSQSREQIKLSKNH